MTLSLKREDYLWPLYRSNKVEIVKSRMYSMASPLYAMNNISLFTGHAESLGQSLSRRFFVDVPLSSILSERRSMFALRDEITDFSQESPFSSFLDRNTNIFYNTGGFSSLG